MTEDTTLSKQNISYKLREAKSRFDEQTERMEKFGFPQRLIERKVNISFSTKELLFLIDLIDGS